MNTDTGASASPPAGMEVFPRGQRTPRPAPTIADMEAAARQILRGRNVDPDGIADQGDVAADIGVTRRSVSWLRQQYQGPAGIRGKHLEPFPAPAKIVGGGAGNPVWLPRWRVLAWHLTRPQTHLPEETTDHA